MTITKRISGTPTVNITKRVATSDATPGVPPVFSNDTWGGTWGETWGRTWFNATALIPGAEASPSQNATKRVGKAPQPNITKRVT